MKKYLVIFLLFPLAYACNRDSEMSKAELEKINEQNTKLLQQANIKDSTITSFIQSFNEIEDNLALIKEKEHIISLTTKGGELQKNDEDRIVEDIQLIYDLLTKNKQKLASMNGKLKKANLRMDEFEKMIVRLNAQLEEKNGQIDTLKKELVNTHMALENLFKEYNDRLNEIDEQTNKLNTAYYAFGTAKELRDHRVTTREGGFIGIGKTEKLMKDFNKDYFTKIDISATKSISILSKKAKLLTSHPSGSYKFEGEGKVDALLITNPEEFWSTSKYLVIVVE